MFSLEKMKYMVQHENVLFAKLGCRFSDAAQKLLSNLHERGIIGDFHIFQLGIDYENKELTELVTLFGWQPEPYQTFCTKPQIFLNQEYIGGNRELHKSRYNLGENGSGVILIHGKNMVTPQNKNPMPF